MAPESVIAFWVVSLLFVLTPGADWAYAISAGLRHRRMLPAIAGLLSGHLLATVAVATGVGALVAQDSMALGVLTIGGSAYLIWLGVSTIRRPATIQTTARAGDETWRRQAARGLGVSGLNPKVFLLFLALLPQFTNPSAAWPFPAQLLVLGLVHVANCAVIYSAVGLGARLVLGARPAAARIIGRLSGAIMLLLGAWLLIEQAIPAFG